MSISTSTGKERDHACDACGRLVHQRELYTKPPGVLSWDSPNHPAPACGLPCLSGGISVATFRSGRFHRATETCAACACMPAPAPSPAPKET